MPDKPETLALLLAYLQDHWPAIYAALLGAGIAALRTIYGGATWRQMLLEPPLCGLITLSACAGLGLIGIPPDAAPLFGGAIGLIGVEGVRKLADRYLATKVQP